MEACLKYRTLIDKADKSTHSWLYNLNKTKCDNTITMTS